MTVPLKWGRAPSIVITIEVKGGGFHFQYQAGHSTHFCKLDLPKIIMMNLAKLLWSLHVRRTHWHSGHTREDQPGFTYIPSVYAYYLWLVKWNLKDAIESDHEHKGAGGHFYTHRVPWFTDTQKHTHRQTISMHKLTNQHRCSNT